MEKVEKKIVEIMSPRPICVEEKNSLAQVHQIFSENDFHHIPVIDENQKIIGIISREDYAVTLDTMTIFGTHRVEELNNRFRKSITAGDIMSKNPVTLKEDTELTVAVGMFLENRFRCIPVINDKDDLVGILTTYDLIKEAFPLKGTLRDIPLSYGLPTPQRE